MLIALMELMILNRNTGTNHFSLAPQIEAERSTFNRSSSHKTTFGVGSIVPIYCDEVLPGDTFKVRTSKVVRLPSLITPVMDDLYLDTYFFFVPNRLVWEHWQQFCGENTDSAWIPEVTYAVPQLTSPAVTGWDTGTLADYFGIPVGVPGLSVNALPFRAYGLICDQFFRNENTNDPFVIPTGDATVAGVNSDTFITDCVKGGKPYLASKMFDYFTACLPSPLKHEDIEIPLVGEGPSPVYTVGDRNDFYKKSDNINGAYPLAFWNGNLNQIPGYAMFLKSPSAQIGDLPSSNWGNAIGSWPAYPGDPTHPTSAPYSFIGDMEYTDGGSSKHFYPTEHTRAELNSLYVSKGNPAGSGDATSNPTFPYNLVAANDPVYASITQLRTAFQIQRFFERQARSGSRYIETLKAFFGVTSPDARLQRAEYLGGNRLLLSIRQVTQTSGSTETGFPLGDVAGQSVTLDEHYDFTKSFVEHGFIIGVAVARYKHTYQQGIERFWSRKDLFDYYWPTFAHLSEMPVYQKEIFAQGTVDDDLVFGYQEAWADYRYKPNRVSGELRSTYTDSLDFWHFGDDYDSAPALSSSWMFEDASNVNRCLAVSDQVSDQVLADFYFDCKATRAMPLYSVPGLIDHF